MKYHYRASAQHFDYRQEKIRMGAASTFLVPRPTAGFRGLKSGRVDAGHRWTVVDDHVDAVSIAHCPHTKRGQSSNPFTWFAR